MLVTRDGLGASIQVNPNTVANAQATAAQHSGEVAVTPTKFNDPMWTRAGVEHAVSYMTSRWEQRIKLTQAALLAQWGPQLQEAHGAQKISCRIGARRGYQSMLYPLGITVALGVPFSIDEVKGKGTIEREYQPDYDQRLEADYAIFQTSQMLLALRMTRPTQPTWIDIGTEDINKAIASSKLSIRDIMRTGEFTYYIDTYGLNPIPPTTEEITAPGGLKAYYARGGYLIAFAATRGQAVVANPGLDYGMGYVLCGGIPAPVLGQVSALRYRAFVTIGPTYKLVLKEAEPGLAQKAVNTVAGALVSLQGVICGSQEMLAQLSSNVLLAEQCALPNGMPCKKGDPGCKCSPPPARQADAVGIANKAVGLWCGRAQTVTPPISPGFKPPPPPSPFNPPPPVGAYAIPWWLVIPLGLGAGALIFGKR